MISIYFWGPFESTATSSHDGCQRIMFLSAEGVGFLPQVLVDEGCPSMDLPGTEVVDHVRMTVPNASMALAACRAA